MQVWGLLLILGQFAFAAPGNLQTNGDASALYLFDVNRNSVEVAKRLLPHRIHVKYLSDVNGGVWAFTKVSPEGKLSEPFEVFRAGSVVPGVFLGSKVEQNFKLLKAGYWVPSEEKPIFHLWIKKLSPELKTVRLSVEQPIQKAPKPRGKRR